MRKQTNLSLDARFKLGFVINSSFMLFEFVVGVFTGSLILIADAAHNLTDSVTLAISWIGNRLSLKPADDDHSLGHGRLSVLAAFVNSIILVVVAVLIFVEAYQRFMHPHKLDGVVIALVGAVGIFTNGLVAYLFRKNRDDLNVKAAFTNMLFDTIFSIAALVAGVLIALTSYTWIDPLISIGVGVGLLYAALGILSQATHIFLEGVPKSIKRNEIEKLILENEGVEKINELAVWAISSNELVVCCVLAMNSDNLENNKLIVKQVKELLNKAGFSKIFVEIA